MSHAFSILGDTMKYHIPQKNQHSFIANILMWRALKWSAIELMYYYQAIVSMEVLRES